MKTKQVIRILILLLCSFNFLSCNKDEEKFNKEEIQQALFDMKGTYHGNVNISYYQGSTIAKLQEVVAVSRDSLKFTMPLSPIAELISDKNLAKYLKEIANVEVLAGYEFLQMDSGNIHFVLHPREVVIQGNKNSSSSVKLVFSQIFGGDASLQQKGIIFNISPVEMWFNNKKVEDFTQLVYHFKGEYE